MEIDICITENLRVCVAAVRVDFTDLLDDVGVLGVQVVVLGDYLDWERRGGGVDDGGGGGVRERSGGGVGEGSGGGVD